MKAHESVRFQELSRILTAAVINESFRKMLLADPAQAVARGFRGEKFHLAKEDKNRLANIQATSLADFAAKMAQY